RPRTQGQNTPGAGPRARSDVAVGDCKRGDRGRRAKSEFAHQDPAVLLDRLVAQGHELRDFARLVATRDERHHFSLPDGELAGGPSRVWQAPLGLSIRVALSVHTQSTRGA